MEGVGRDGDGRDRKWIDEGVIDVKMKKDWDFQHIQSGEG